MPEPYRVAVYYAPEPGDPLWGRGCAWLGRDPETGRAVPPPDVPGIAALTTDPRRYGFHATLKPPMRLAFTLPAFLADVAALAAETPAFALPALQVTQLGDCVALCLTDPCPEMQALADACVTRLDRHRLPEDAAAQAKRAAGRSARQLQLLERWGYPFVLDEFLFHMTLSNGLANNQLAPAAEAYFADAVRLPRRVTQLAVFTQEAAGAPFNIARRFALRG